MKKQFAIYWDNQYASAAVQCPAATHEDAELYAEKLIKSLQNANPALTYTYNVFEIIGTEYDQNDKPEALLLRVPLNQIKQPLTNKPT